jgi:hypothetical protein
MQCPTDGALSSRCRRFRPLQQFPAVRQSTLAKVAGLAAELDFPLCRRRERRQDFPIVIAVDRLSPSSLSYWG